jgi:hypothetical protein
MKDTNGKLLQKNSLSLYQTSSWKLVLEIFLLSVLGVLGVVLHARLKLGLGIPGHHGFIFMSLIMAGRLNSKLRFASSISTLAAALFLYLPILGFKDPFMPLIYLSIGISVDVLNFVLPSKKHFAFVALIAGLSYIMIPLLRLAFMATFGYPYLSFRHGFVLPFLTHFAFGSLGGLIAVSATKLLSKKK